MRQFFRLTACLWIIWLNRESVRVKRKETSSSSPSRYSFVRSWIPFSYETRVWIYLFVVTIARVLHLHSRYSSSCPRHPRHHRALNSRASLRAKRRDSWINNSFVCFVRCRTWKPIAAWRILFEVREAKFRDALEAETFVERFWHFANCAASTRSRKKRNVRLFRLLIGSC